MPETETLSVRITRQAKAELGELATRTKRTRSFLAAEAISAYLEYELSIIKAIEQGQADVLAGNVTPHEEVMREARRIIADARQKK